MITRHSPGTAMVRLFCIMTVLALLIAACGATPTPTPTPVPPTATQMALPTAAPVPPTATRVPPTNTPVPPSTWIAGLTAVDVTGNLKNKGFTCSGPTVAQSTWRWECTSKEQGGLVEYRVITEGQGTNRIDLVNATVLQYGAQASNTLAAQFLGYVSTVPYSGADPARARQWVESQLASGGTVTIGGATFQLFGPITGKSLQITPAGM